MSDHPPRSAESAPTVDVGGEDFAPLRDRLAQETNKLAGRGFFFDNAAWWAAVQAIADHAYQLGLAAHSDGDQP